MRNLKRVLSLALALVMVIGMMVIGAGAASFGDQKDIAKEEAAAVMQGLGIMEGDENGNFNPDDVLTREQAAAMLARTVLGEKGAETVAANKVGVFVDVAADRWSAGYIAWAANQDYIAGWNGQFDPAGQLTGVAYAKLLLVALGFDPEVEGYVNNINWAANIGADAVAFGLTKNVDDILAAPLTRENAAQMTLNALEATCVYYEDKGFEIITADGTVIRQGVEGPYALGATDARWDDRETNKNYDETDDEGKDTKDNVVHLVEKLFPKVVKTGADPDEWGNPADFCWKNGNKTLYTEWLKPVAEYYVAVSDCDLAKELDLAKKDSADIYVDGVLADTNYVYDIYEDDYTFNGTGTGVWTRIYETPDDNAKNGDEYTVVAINTYLAEVTKVTTERVDKNDHVKREASIDLDVWAASDEWTKETASDKADYDLTYETEDFKKGDMVLVTILKADEDYDQVDADEYVVKSVELAESVEAKVSKVRKAADDRLIDNITITADGEPYGANVQFELGFAPATKTTYELYLDEQGNVIGAELPKGGDSDYYVISSMKYDSNDEDDEIDSWVDATLYNMDAEKIDDATLVSIDAYWNDLDTDAVYVGFVDADTNNSVGDILTVGKKDYMQASDKANRNGEFYFQLIEMAADESEYEVGKVAETLTAAAEGVDALVLKADTLLDATTLDKDFNDNTKFLVLTTEKGKAVFTAYSFEDLPAMEVEAIQYVEGKNYIKYVFVDARDALFLGETTLVYIVEEEIKAIDNGLESFDAWVGAEDEEFDLAEIDGYTSIEDYGFEGDGIYTLYYNSDEEVIEMKLESAPILVKDATGKTITEVITGTHYRYASDIEVYEVVVKNDAKDNEFREINASSIDDMLDYIDDAQEEGVIVDGKIEVAIKLTKAGKVETLYYVYNEEVDEQH